jgi:hypothetical protein
MALFELDCLTLLNSLPLKYFKYVDFVEKARELVEIFKKENCELIIALTHMRINNEKHN